MSTMRIPIASRSFATSRAIGVQRSFTTSRVSGVGKESAVHDDDRAAKVEALKQDQLAKQKQGEQQWSEELASDSEVNVKADRQVEHRSIKEMQRDGAKKAEEDKKR